MKYCDLHVRISSENKKFIEELAKKLGTTQSTVIELAIWILRLIYSKNIPLNKLKMYIKPQLIKYLYENSIEHRKTLKQICEELGYVI